jgi:hypothetical protein
MATPRPPDPPKQSESRSNRNSCFQAAPLQFTETNYKIVADDEVGERLVRVERPPEKMEDKLERAREVRDPYGDGGLEIQH